MFRYLTIFMAVLIVASGLVSAAPDAQKESLQSLEFACSAGAAMRPQALLYRALTDRMAQRAGYKVTFTEYPWLRAISQMKTGAIAGIYCLSYLPEREAWADYFPIPFFTAKIALFKFKSNPLAYSTWSDLLQQQIAVQKDSYNANQLIARGASNLIYVYNDEVECRLLRSGRVTLLISDQKSPCSGDNGGSSTGERDVVPIGPPVSVDHLHVGFSRARGDHARVGDDFMQAFQALLKEGEIARIYQSHNMELPDHIKAMLEGMTELSPPETEPQ